MSHPLIWSNREVLSQPPYCLSFKQETFEGKDVYVVDYDQIYSERHNPLCDVCRGVVVDADTEEVVCWPFNRFYNFGEGSLQEKEFEWNNSFSMSKEDGSLIKVYHWNGEWRIATRGTAFGANTVTDLLGEEQGITFRQLFLKTLGATEEQFQKKMDSLFVRGSTIMFELCTKWNKVVTPYDEDKVFILGARFGKDVVNNQVFTISVAESFKREGMSLYSPEYYHFSSFQEAVDTANSLEGLREGFVVCDVNGNMVKIKSSVYVKVHKTRGNGMTAKRVCDMVFENEHHEFVAYFPEVTEYVENIVNRYTSLFESAQNVYQSICDIGDQKQFALRATKHQFSGLLFSMRKGLSLKEAFDKCTQNTKYKLVLGEGSA